MGETGQQPGQLVAVESGGMNPEQHQGASVPPSVWALHGAEGSPAMSEASGESEPTLPAARAPHHASLMDRAAQRGQANKRKGQVIPPTT